MLWSIFSSLKYVLKIVPLLFFFYLRNNDYCFFILFFFIINVFSTQSPVFRVIKFTVRSLLALLQIDFNEYFIQIVILSQISYL